MSGKKISNLFLLRLGIIKLLLRQNKHSMDNKRLIYGNLKKTSIFITIVFILTACNQTILDLEFVFTESSVPPTRW